VSRTNQQRRVRKWNIDVRYTGHMNYLRPVEAVIARATGRLLAALGRVKAERPLSTLANIAGVAEDALMYHR
jgi:CelD/BcsL family acetyltransferase involved in cellulose biosynthesis